MPKQCARQRIPVVRLGLVFVLGSVLVARLLWALVAVQAFQPVLAQAPIVRYVAPSPLGQDDGNTCAVSTAPCATVQRAVNVADPHDEIRVAEGIYTDVHARYGITQVAYVSETVTIRGGYTTADWTASDPVLHPTTLDAQGQGHVLRISGDISVTVSGLRLTGGSAHNGGGISLSAVTATLTNNWIYSNTAQNTGGGIYVGYRFPGLSPVIFGNQVMSNTAHGGGGGLALSFSNAVVDQNLIANNDAPGKRGGGVYISGGSPHLKDNTIRDNDASGYAGGVYIYRASPIVEANRILSNTSSNGGGIFVDDYASPSIVNNLIAKNLARSNGGGIYIDYYSRPRIVYNTIWGNDRGPSWANEGIFMYNRPSPTIVNNIIAQHASCIEGTPLSITLGHNLLWDCTVVQIANVIQVCDVEHIYKDPRLRDPAHDDYHLLGDSPAIDAGCQVYTPLTDFDQERRPTGRGYDVGADEYWSILFLPLVQK